MTASFNLTLDTQAPAAPALLIDAGAAVTGQQGVEVTISSADHVSGANDVSLMKVWGDVDPTADPAIQAAEVDSEWIAFSTSLAVLLSAGDARKTLYSKIRDTSGNTTLAFSDFIDLDSTVPMVDITTAVDRSRISKIASFDAATFTWEASSAFVEYQVRVVPTHGSPQQSGVLIPTTAGSLNTSGSGAFDATTPIITTIRGTDLQAASPGDTTKVCKVFVRTAGGVWSP